MSSHAFSFGTTRRNQAKAKTSAPDVSIGDLRHRVSLCSASDVVIDGATIALSRPEALKVWASVKEKRGSFWSRDGKAVKESRDSQSHEVFIRYRKDFEITSAAWLYEERRDNPPRWFKVLSVSEKCEIGVSQWFWRLSCRLVEKGDLVARPTEPEPEAKPNAAMAAAPLPAGVRL